MLVSRKPLANVLYKVQWRIRGGMHSRTDMWIIMESLALFFRTMTQRSSAGSRNALHGSVLPSLSIAVAASDGYSFCDAPGDTFQSGSINDQSNHCIEEFVGTDQSNKSVAKSVSEQLSIGAVLGFATGYSIRKIGRALLFLVGTEVVILQYMAYREWLTMDWARIAKDITPKLRKSTWGGVTEILVYKMPFSAAFTGGLLAALRFSSSSK